MIKLSSNGKDIYILGHIMDMLSITRSVPRHPKFECLHPSRSLQSFSKDLMLKCMDQHATNKVLQSDKTPATRHFAAERGRYAN